MNCKNCNNLLAENAKFCGKCGKSVLIEDSPTLSVENKKTPSGGEMIKRILKIILIIFFVSMTSSVSSKQSTVGDGWIGDIYNILTIVSVVTFFVLLSKWWKNRKTNKKWFNWRWITLLLVLSLVSFMMLVFSQALISARLKSFGLSQTSSMNGNWVSYNSPDNTFSVQFPLPPSYDTKSQDSENGKIYVDTYKSADETASVGYAVSVTKFPPNLDFSNTNDILEKLVNLSATNINGTIITSKFITQDGYPAIDYLIKGKTTSKVRGINIIVGQNVYQLITSYDTSDETKLEFEKFVGSFKLK
ncbi:MAG TPA: zinc ribbon domain-containing protein [Candidatus Paceibacterota bacterium]|nr:zinc ribbon domain-containing protein [Candidatus Paceibacterota bacterium]